VIPDTNRVTFAVHCYDVGASTLDNLPGVLQIERGWQGRQEVNRIVFDPRQISVEQMAEHLRRAGTYLGTLNATGHPEPGQDSPR
jgi:peptide methionine sulfoxide reductase MsrA